MPAILKASNLVKTYGDFSAVDNVSFEVEEGEIFGLLGPNGAGKTTTISMLTGLFEPTSGTATIGGYDIRENLNEVKKLSGLVPQDLALYPTLSARANLNFFGRIYGLGGKQLKERVDEVLRIVSLTDRADETIETYSGGMKRRINIAAGLIHLPKLLYLDEPTVGVDPQSRNKIFESVLQLNRDQGMSIIYTSHYMEEVELLCNRVAIIDHGKIIAMDTIKNLVALLGGGLLQIGLRNPSELIISQIKALPEIKDAYIQSASIPEGIDEDASSSETFSPKIIKIETENSQKALLNVISLLNERDITIESLDILEPNLESVFLHLTGKKLRE